MAKESGQKVIASNRKARHDYSILDTYEAGVVLVGTEVKSLRAGRASLVDAFATVGAEYRAGLNLYAEGGLRGPLLGPAGWRAYVRGSSAGLGAGVGVELRF